MTPDDCGGCTPTHAAPVGTGSFGGVSVLAGSPCEGGGMQDVSPERFEQLVEAALNVIPADLAGMMQNVAVIVEDEAPPDDPHLLGRYEGVPLTERDTWYVAALPDRIRIFRGPILRICETQAEVVREVYITVVHEVAHHFGIDDDKLHDLGYA